MKLFYHLYHGDALKILPTFSAKSVDAVITDPPMMLSSGAVIRRKVHHMYKARKDIVLDFGDWDKFKSREEFLEFTEKWVRECCRIIKEGGAFISYFSKRYVSYLCDLLESEGFKIKDILVHIVSNPPPQARKVKFMQNTLFIVWAVKGEKGFTFNWELGYHPNYIITPICMGRERIRDPFHPTQKPLKAIKWLVSYLTRPYDIVLDPFIGVGTTMEACQDLRRSCIGIEINKKYCEAVIRRCFHRQFLDVDVSYEFKELYRT